MNATAILADQILFARDSTLATLQTIAPEHRFTPIAPGRAHTHWTVGHLASAVNNALLRYILNTPTVISEELIAVYAPGQRGGQGPLPDPAKFPDWDTTLDAYVKSMQTAAERLRGMDDAFLDGLSLWPEAPEAWHKRFPTAGRGVFHLIAHDAYHRGQLGIIAAITKV